MSFKNKVVLVTGSTRGLGKGIAMAFAREGASVAINGTKEDLCGKVADEVKSAGGRGIAVPGDISDTEVVKSIFRQVFDQFDHLDILVNNAGIVYVADCTDTTDLGIIPLGRYETPADVANLTLFLASEQASYITGQSINITGGIETH